METAPRSDGQEEVGNGEEIAAAAATASAAAEPSSSGEEPVVVAVVDNTPAMIGYFGCLFGQAAINAFFGVIFDDYGFSKDSIGLLVAIIPVLNIVLLPVLGFIADKYHCSTSMLMVCAVGSTISVFVFTSANVVPVIVSAYVLLVIFETPMNPLLDKHTLMMFPPETRSSSWAYVRAFGAYGWGVGNPVASLLKTWAGTWSIVAVQYLIGQLSLVYCMRKIKPFAPVARAEVRYMDLLKIVFLNYRLCLFLFASCAMGMGYSFINNFLFIFLKEIGGPTILMGLSLLLTVSTEIPLFQHSDRLHAWMTERQMMSLAMVLWAIRVIGYSMLHRPWFVLFLEPLHGITFGLMWIPSMRVVSQAFPPHLASSATSVLFMFVCGIGAIIGNVCAGFLYQHIGARNMFRTAAVAMLVILLVYQVVDRALARLGYSLTETQFQVLASPTTHAVIVCEESEKLSPSSPDVMKAEHDALHIDCLGDVELPSICP